MIGSLNTLDSEGVEALSAAAVDCLVLLVYLVFFVFSESNWFFNEMLGRLARAGCDETVFGV